MLELDIRGEEIHLLSERALLWPSQKTLIAADLHWGKTAHFRKHGIAIPIGAQQADETRLSRLIEKHRVERLVVAGDMFHSVRNNQVDGFAHWRNSHKELHIELVLGNHDILDQERYAEKNILVHNEVLDAGPFLVSHDELEQPGKFYIHGHLHPCFTAGGRGRNSVKTQCFCMDESRMVLPSFGSFTGCCNISSSEYCHIYLIANDEVIQWQ